MTKDRISEDKILAIPSAEYPFHIHLDSSNIGTGYILMQQFPEGKRIISFNSRIFDKAEQKMSTLHKALCGIVSALQTYEHYIIGSPFAKKLYCDHKPILYLWGRKRHLSHRFFWYHVLITKFQNLKIIWTPGSNLASPDTLSRNVTIDEYQHHQLQHKKLPRDIQFFDEHEQQIMYKISHDDTSAETCNDFHPIHCQQGKDQKILRLHNDGDNFSLNSISTNFAASSVQLAADCFRMGRTINQLRRLWRPGSPVSLSPSENSTGTYSSINVIETDGIEEPGSSSDVERVVPQVCDIDKDEDDYVCEINANDQYRLCKARAAHDLLISDPDTLQAKKTLSTTAAPHLRTQDLITKLDDVSKIVDLDVPTILQEQLKDQVLSIVRSWIERNLSSDLRAPEIRQSEGLLRYGQELDRLFIEEHGQLLCYDEPSDTLAGRNLRICLPLSLFLACFRIGHYNEPGGHMGASKTYANAKRFCYWPGMFDWICALTADCLACQDKKPKPKHPYEVPLEEWQGDTAPFCTLHIDHKGLLHPPTNRNIQCLLIIDSFSRVS